ncbi:MFS transporter [Sphingomonas ginkgonis]|uniref:MFS transporter n=1 Tax=Sphingomonas ginkgonis TaxID=2315330 RepID=A0A3R9Y547_9SPHN|nr:MFS transporter [Sphingomonas ginkgonis]RST30347.1 MFS transporter [Sphingomonas ginkgonis]
MASIADRTGRAALRWLVVLLGAAVFLNYVDRGAVGIAAPLMKGDLKLTNEQFGIAVSAFFWIYAPVQLVVGWLCDRFSVTRILAGGVLLWAASTLLIGFAGGFASLLVLRVLLGVGESIAFPASSKIIAEQVPAGGRGAANAIVSAALALGPAVGTLAGGAILASLGWRAIFWIFGVITLVWLLPWSRAARTLAAGRERPAPVPLGRLLGRWSLWAMSIAHFASNYTFYFLLTWLPLFLTKSQGYTIWQMTLLATFGYAVQAAAATVAGTLSDRWTRAGHDEGRIRRAMMVGGQLVAAVAVLGIFVAGSGPILALMLALAGAATGVLSLNTYAVGQMFAGPRAAGSWIGFQNALGNMSGILGPIVTGALVDNAGYASAFLVTGAVALFGALWWLVAVPRIHQVALD